MQYSWSIYESCASVNTLLNNNGSIYPPLIIKRRIAVLRQILFLFLVRLRCRPKEKHTDIQFRRKKRRPPSEVSIKQWCCSLYLIFRLPPILTSLEYAVRKIHYIFPYFISGCKALIASSRSSAFFCISSPMWISNSRPSRRISTSIWTSYVDPPQHSLPYTISTRRNTRSTSANGTAYHLNPALKTMYPLPVSLCRKSPHERMQHLAQRCFRLCTDIPLDMCAWRSSFSLA